MNAFDPVRAALPHLAQLDAYHPIPAVAYSREVLKLDLNESPVPPSPRVVSALQTALAQPAALNWYPDPTCTQLRDAISRYVGLPADHVLVTNGSNQAMETISRAYVGAADPVLIAAPTYGVFKQQCQLRQARLREFHFKDPFAPRMGELLGLGEHWKAIFVANPNNPTGAGLARNQIQELLAAQPEALVVLDEAYAEFHDQPCHDLVSQHPNLLVLRSLSKAFALAGIRCGYILAQPATLAPMQQVFPPWSVSSLTQVAAIAALGDLEYMRELTAECRVARRALVAGLKGLGQQVRDTAANFVLWQVPEPARIQRALAARGVYVSNKDQVPQLQGCLRVTVGNRQQVQAFLDHVRQVLGL
jgi:histidinol-phosphate aminotransferase